MTEPGNKRKLNDASALHDACEKGDETALKTLIEGGAELMSIPNMIE
jgi:hypothetical protein